MRVSIVQGGGLVPIVTTTIADSASLSHENAEALRRKVEDAGLFGLSAAGGDRHPDRPSYEITVEDDGRQNQVVLDDAALPDAVRSLISWVGSVPGHQQRIGPPGRG